MDQQQGETVRGRSKRKMVIEESIPYILCILANLSFSGYNIVSKISLDKGILVFLFERNNDSKLSIPVLRNVFFLGLLGAVFGRTLFYIGLEYTSTILASAVGNTFPSMTFILAVLCRMDKFDILNRVTQAKVAGTVVAFAGATVMTLYKGFSVVQVHLIQFSYQTATSPKQSVDKNWIKGSLLLVVSSFSLAAFFILQTTTVKLYPAPLSLTSLTCLSGTLVSAIMTAILDHKAASWRLSWDITLLAPLYSGVVVFGIAVYVQTLVIRRKGPVFVTAFRPLSTLFVAIMALLILGEALHLGSIVGATLIIVGLYAFLWGKKKEKENI